MLKRVFPERQPKSANRPTTASTTVLSSSSSQQSPSSGAYARHEGSNVGTTTAGAASSSPSSSPLKASISTGRFSSSSSSSPVKSEALLTSTIECSHSGAAVSSTATNLSKLKTISRSCSSTEFQSLKLESMSTVEDFKSVSKTISSVLERDGMLGKQSSVNIYNPASGNDVQESTSLSTPSDEDLDNDPAESLFKHQAKFFSQMKEYLLSQQSSLRQHLELLNATVASRKKKVTSRRQRFVSSGHSHSVHLPAKQKAEVAPEIRGSNHDIDLNEFHSCSSTERSDDDIQVCPLCGVEIEESENPDALEEHVASHWCSPDDPI